MLNLANVPNRLDRCVKYVIVLPYAFAPEPHFGNSFASGTVDGAVEDGFQVLA